jgi:hypothetical protein
MVSLFGLTFSLKQTSNRNPLLIAETARNATQNGYAVIFCPPDYILNFTYYYRRDLFTLTDEKSRCDLIIKQLNTENIYPVWNINEIMVTRPKWLYIDVVAALTTPDNGILESLKFRFTQIKEEQLDDVTKAYYFLGHTKSNKIIQSK